jgi:hypothetical protein
MNPVFICSWDGWVGSHDQSNLVTNAQRHSCLRLELYKSWCFRLYYKCQVIVNCIVTLLFILQIDTRIRDGDGNKNAFPEGTFLCFNLLYPWCGCLLWTHSTKGKDQTSLSNQPLSHRLHTNIQARSLNMVECVFLNWVNLETVYWFCWIP